MIWMLDGDIYKLNSKKNEIRDVRMRGRLRKFAVLTGEDISPIKEFLIKIVPDMKIEKSQVILRI